MADMTRIENIFFTLLRSGLSGERATLVEYVPISDKEWQKVYDLFTDQGLVGIGFTAIELLDKSQLPDMDTLMDWLGQTEYVTSSNEEYRRNSKEFLAMVRGEGLEVRVLKGMECAKYYPVPERRALGDLDIVCFNANHNANVNCISEGYRLCNEICERNGWKVDFHDYKHSKIKFRTLDIENHRYCTEIRGERYKKEFERHLQELLLAGVLDKNQKNPSGEEEPVGLVDSASENPCEQAPRYSLLHSQQFSKLNSSSTEAKNPFDKLRINSDFAKNLSSGNHLKPSKTSEAMEPSETARTQFDALFLMAHAMNHFLDEGLSLRQICDWGMFVQHEQNNVDWKDFYLWMERMHGRRFADALNAICVRYLGVVINNREVVTESPFADRILRDAMYVNHHLHNSGLHGWRYRWAQFRIACSGRWKYRDICQQNFLLEYIKGCWYYVMERNPKL